MLGMSLGVTLFSGWYGRMQMIGDSVSLLLGVAGSIVALYLVYLGDQKFEPNTIYVYTVDD